MIALHMFKINTRWQYYLPDFPHPLEFILNGKTVAFVWFIYLFIFSVLSIPIQISGVWKLVILLKLFWGLEPFLCRRIHVKHEPAALIAMAHLLNKKTVNPFIPPPPIKNKNLKCCIDQTGGQEFGSSSLNTLQCCTPNVLHTDSGHWG